jgi:insulysin
MIIKPKFDNRQYYSDILDNDIKYCYINDPTLQRTYVSVCLNVGSFHNYEFYHGTAHFLEHMLFMGSGKYPDENYYSNRLNELGGTSNAYTGKMETVYYFNVLDNGLEEMFDIFSRFFIDPLFNENSISKEINAVDSEHNKNINNDLWRTYNLMLNLTNKNSPINTFPTGSLNTLNKPDIREKLIEFYKKYYTSDNISICIASSKSYDLVKDMLKNTFGLINKSTSEKLVIDKPFLSDNIRKHYHLKTIDNTFKSIYMWEIPFHEDIKHTRPFNILGNIITSLSKNSLHYNLKNEGLIENMYFEIEDEGLFILNIILTENGFNNINYINSSLNKYMNQIYELNLKEYAMYYHKKKNVLFNINTETDTEYLCNKLSTNLHKYDTKYILNTNYNIINDTSYYKDLYEKYISYDNNINILLSNNNYSSDLIYTKLKEYNAEFVELPNNFKNVIVNKNFDFYETENEYLDIKVNIKNIKDNESPILIDNKQWYCGVSKFNEPLVTINLLLTNENYLNTPLNYLLTNLSCSILNFISEIVLFKSLETNYSIMFNTNINTSSIHLNIIGINEIKLLIDNIQDMLLNIDEHFNILSKNYIDNLILSNKNSIKNIHNINPWNYSDYIMNTLLFNNVYNVDELLNELNNINYDIIKNYISNLLNNISLTLFVYGNIEKENVINLFNKLPNNNKKTELPQINKLNNIIIKHPNIIEKSNCIVLCYYIGKNTLYNSNSANMIIKILNTLFFDDLRTKNQLGYLVSMYKKMYIDNIYIIQKIQSEKDIDFIKTKLNEFNDKLIEYINNVDFDIYLNMYKNILEEPFYNSDDEFVYFNNEIEIKQFLFNRKQLLLNNLNNINKNDIINFAKQYLIPNNRTEIIIKGQ